MGAKKDLSKLKAAAKKNNDKAIATSGQERLGFDTSKYIPSNGAKGGGDGGSGATDFDMSLQSHFKTFATCHEKCDPYCGTRAARAVPPDIMSTLKFCNCGCCSDGTGNVCWSCTGAPPVGPPREETCFAEAQWHMPGFDQGLN